LFWLQRSWLGGLLAAVASAILSAICFNLFMIPHQLLSGGMSGLSMLISYITGWDVSLLYMALNAPVLIWGLITVGRKFILLSVVSVVLTSLFLRWLPAVPVAEDLILNAVTGGVLLGIGTGLAMRSGGSTGGFDILGYILTRKRDFPLGAILFVMNGIVIVALGYYEQNWDLALYSLLSIYITVKIVDAIHIRHVKVTVFVVTRKKDILLPKMSKLQRGITVLQTEGAFTKQPQHMLMTVITRYELNDVQAILRQWDPQAFVNIVETTGVMGLFRRS